MPLFLSSLIERIGGAIVAWLVAALVLLALIANTYRLSAAVDFEHAALVECQSEKERLALRVEEQNQAIENWKLSATVAAQRAAAALAEVDRKDEERRQAVASLDAWKRTAGETECDAARRLLLEYRK